MKRIVLQKIYSVWRLLDEITLVKWLNFDQYFNFHRLLNFKLRKIAFFLDQGYDLNLDNPRTFNEKVVYRHLFERDSLLPYIVDKYKVREYVSEKIGEEYLIPLLQVADSFEKVDFYSLPENYVMKMNHASGRNIIVKNGVNHLGYSDKKLKEIFKTWFDEKYRFQQFIWFVQPIKRKIVIEELLVNQDGNIPKDYKFFVFDGKVEFIQVDQERFSEHKQNYYDKNWNRSNFSWRCPTGDMDEKPITLEKMLELSEKLASEFTFMRVDFYTFQEKIYFGELTPCPGGGSAIFKPQDFDQYYGKLWSDKRLSRENKK